MVFSGVSAESIGIFDSNVWALGFTERNQDCVDLIEDVRTGIRRVAINSYIYHEIDSIFDDISDPDARSQTKQNFAHFIYDCRSVAVADAESVSSLSLQEERRRSEMQLISHLSGCETDDAPILLLAWEVVSSIPALQNRTITIYTTDEAFANAVEDCGNLPNIQSVRILVS